MTTDLELDRKMLFQYYSSSLTVLFPTTTSQKLAVGGLFYQFSLPDEKGITTRFAASKRTSAAMLAVRQVRHAYSHP